MVTAVTLTPLVCIKVRTASHEHPIYSPLTVTPDYYTRIYITNSSPSAISWVVSSTTRFVLNHPTGGSAASMHSLSYRADFSQASSVTEGICASILVGMLGG